jgi:hypothetical protein
MKQVEILTDQYLTELENKINSFCSDSSKEIIDMKFLYDENKYCVLIIYDI